jgi:uncharacterized membrane protein YeaQ/YmgE (transglycosylase-associated protein family)
MRVTDWVSAILIGIVVGVLGRLVLPGRQRIGVFATFVVGVLAALLGTVIARWLNVETAAPAHFGGLHWSWMVLGIQVVFGVIGVALAQAMTNSRLAGEPRRRRRTTRRRRTSRA